MIAAEPPAPLFCSYLSDKPLEVTALHNDKRMTIPQLAAPILPICSPLHISDTLTIRSIALLIRPGVKSLRLTQGVA